MADTGKECGITWDPPLFIDRLDTLRAYNADRIDKAVLVSMLGLPPLSVQTDEMDPIEDNEVEVAVDGTDDTTIDDEAHLGVVAANPLTIEIPPPLQFASKHPDADPQFQPRSSAVRLMGEARLYSGGGGVACSIPNSVSTKKIHMVDRVVSVFDPVGLHVASITLEMTAEYYQKTNPDVSKHVISVVWKELRFHTPQLSSEGVYISYHGWATKRGYVHAKLTKLTLLGWNVMCTLVRRATPKVTSITGVFAFAHHRMSFEVLVPRNQNVDDFFQTEYLSMEVWGWGNVPPSPLSRPLSSSSPASSSSSLLSELSTSSLQQDPLLPRRPRSSKVDVFVSVDVEERRKADGLYAPVTVKEDGTLRLSQHTSRRLVVRVVQADQQPFCLGSIAHIRIAPARPTTGHSKSQSQFEAATALGSATLGGFFKRFGTKDTLEPHMEDWTTWTTLPIRGPIQVDKEARSVVCVMKWDADPREAVDGRGQRRVFRIALAVETTLSCVPVVLSTKFTAKVLGKMKKDTAWWAREHVSRMHRLGHWFSMDVGLDDDAPRTEVVAEKLLDHFGKGMEKLQAAYKLERFRQQVAAEAAVHGEAALIRVANLPDLGFQLTRERDEWTIASRSMPQVTIHVMSGVEMNPPAPPNFSTHKTRALTDPSPSDPLAGEWSGYLMQATSSSSMWNRRWFVLQRPLLCCYKTFAKGEVVGVLDISKCTVEIDKHMTLFPFSFRVTSVVDKVPMTWQLQASSADEMQAWIHGIAPAAMLDKQY
ncbi:hypothetical protein DYB34_002513 [Aphanomyces astaci]|uniref:PH domain-containing protein n=1 Tax=Aphanomyces astaci TaxID=112090 RepID=A0A3R6WI25_APHAT|nr:hypothetical protein DYB34_002513 [Aphanomyces astaci]